MELNVREFREMRNLSYEQLSKESCIARSYLQRLESSDDKVNPSACILCRLAKALDVPVGKLFNCD